MEVIMCARDWLYGLAAISFYINNSFLHCFLIFIRFFNLILNVDLHGMRVDQLVEDAVNLTISNEPSTQDSNTVSRQL